MNEDDRTIEALVAGREIDRTGVTARHPWPDDIYIQGGSRGVVLADRHPEGSYRTAFVEVFPRNPNTFLRGEGPTVEAAEDACWAKYARMTACPAAPEHGPFEARQFTNGSGFCTGCGTWFSRCLPERPESPDRTPSLMERVFTGDAEALVTVVEAVANADELPEKPAGAGR